MLRAALAGQGGLEFWGGASREGRVGAVPGPTPSSPGGWWGCGATRGGTAGRGLRRESETLWAQLPELSGREKTRGLVPVSEEGCNVGCAWLAGAQG